MDAGAFKDALPAPNGLLSLFINHGTPSAAAPTTNPAIPATSGDRSERPAFAGAVDDIGTIGGVAIGGVGTVGGIDESCGTMGFGTVGSDMGFTVATSAPAEASREALDANRSN